ncbi:hypothetical protein SAMN05421664_1470 [Chryseobacterium soldanellicola]|uniref:Uncharacterized protein n=1 Tax=Chryseobacterium soldanellicola TaxID=311333 RepID=A0A1H1AKW9_9FLAO|nr:hypothetical protein [Chryseobacterium soldanellicola]SDQ40282.1 hypothetical protein SAMN05421664_1470 [Chryseobacterium soldanellicola]
MNLNLITLISEYNRLKMISIYEPLEVLKKLSQTHNDEVLIARLTYRSGIINFDTDFFEKAVAATNFNLDEILKNTNGLEMTMKDFLTFIAIQVGEELAKFYDKEVDKI